MITGNIRLQTVSSAEASNDPPYFSSLKDQDEEIAVIYYVLKRFRLNSSTFEKP